MSGLIASQQKFAALARSQHGVVTRRQLLSAAISPQTIKSLVAAGWLRPLYRGVYLVGLTERKWSRQMGAVLACGQGAVLSHRSAAALWNLLPHPAREPAVDVTVPPHRGPRRRGIRVHRSDIGPGEATKANRIAVTTPARTLLDLAAEASVAELERATAKVLANRTVSRQKLRDLLARHPRRPGAPRLRELLEGRPAMTRAETEWRLLNLIRRAGLPVPDTNVMLEGYEVDFLWREERLVVETDGFETHSSRQSFEADRRRDGELAARGLTVVRVTWRQLTDEPEAVVVRLARTLERRAA